MSCIHLSGVADKFSYSQAGYDPGKLISNQKFKLTSMLVLNEKKPLFRGFF